jgi:DNA end-binding protein Ku
MAPRAQWKGHLKVDEINCAVALYTAASTSERTRFHMVNSQTGNRLSREFLDEQTGKAVPKDAQVKGYETASGQYVILEQEEIDAVIPQSDKTLSVEAFIPCNDVDTVYFDKPYYIAPADAVSEDVFRLIREGMKKKSVAALAKAVLFRRARTLMIRPHGSGLVANTLNFDYEVRSSKEAFDDVPSPKIKKEMMDLAAHIIGTMYGEFDPLTTEDRYEAAVAELVRAKMEGREIKIPRRRASKKVVDLMAALRESAKMAEKGSSKTKRSAKKSTATGKKAA